MVHLTEVALDGFPAAASGDAHCLVVVAGRTARGKGIVEPEAVVLRQTVGRVGEGGGSLVGGDHEIGVITVKAEHVMGRHKLVVDQIVGDLQETGDEQLVGAGAFGEDFFARSAGGEFLRYEAALGADRHDYRILDVLGLHQTEDLGAEILRTVGPAQTTAGDHATAQVDAFDVGRVDEDLGEGARVGQFLDLAGVDLEGHGRLIGTVFGLLIKIRAQHGHDEVHEAAHNAVFIKRGDALEDFFDFVGDLLCGGVALGGISLVEVEAGVEHVDQQAGKIAVFDHGGGHVVTGIRDAGLAQVLAAGAQQSNVAPFHAFAEDEGVVAIVFSQAVPHGKKAVFELLAAGLDVVLIAAAGGLQADFVNEDAAGRLGAVAGEGEAVLLDGAKPHVLENGHAVGERHGLVVVIELETGYARWVGKNGVELDGDVLAFAKRLDFADVVERVLWREGFLVTAGKGISVFALQAAGFVRRQALGNGFDETVVPGANHFGNAALQFGDAGA